jgi:4-carboxymuconolactone decarboxylase
MKNNTEMHQFKIARINRLNSNTTHQHKDEPSMDPCPGSAGTTIQPEMERVMAKPDLNLLIREYLFIASCVALRRPAPLLRAHVASALKLGATKEQILEVIRQTISYAGAEAVAEALHTAKAMLRAIVPQVDSPLRYHSAISEYRSYHPASLNAACGAPDGAPPGHGPMKPR